MAAPPHPPRIAVKTVERPRRPPRQRHYQRAPTGRPVLRPSHDEPPPAASPPKA